MFSRGEWKKMVWVGQPESKETAPFALMLLTLYRQKRFTSNLSVCVGFTCHSNGASWASFRELAS